MMKLENLRISRVDTRWSEPLPDGDKYRGTAEFTGTLGKIEVKLDNEQVHEILKLCADNVIKTASEVAQTLVTPVIELTEKEVLKIEELKK